MSSERQATASASACGPGLARLRPAEAVVKLANVPVDEDVDLADTRELVEHLLAVSPELLGVAEDDLGEDVVSRRGKPDPADLLARHQQRGDLLTVPGLKPEAEQRVELESHLEGIRDPDHLDRVVGNQLEHAGTDGPGSDAKVLGDLPVRATTVLLELDEDAAVEIVQQVASFLRIAQICRNVLTRYTMSIYCATPTQEYAVSCSCNCTRGSQPEWVRGMPWPWVKTRREGPRLRAFVASDIHGSDVCWRKFLNAGRFYRADLLVLAGDVTGKALVPVVDLGGGRFRARLMGQEELVEDAAALAGLEGRIRFNGFYPHRCSPDEAEAMKTDRSLRGAAFATAMRKTAEDWVALADERLRGTGVRCLVMPGNDDEWFLEEVLASSETIENHDGRVVDVNGYQVIGNGWSNPTPWNSAREKPDPEIEADLVPLLEAASGRGPVILNPHVPPYGSSLDLAPKLREDLTIVTTAGHPQMVPVGSQAVRNVIERYQPFLSLHGHIHESRGVVRLGNTISVNPGSEYNVGRLLGVLIDLVGADVTSTQLVAG